MRWVVLTAAMFALLLVSFDQGWKRGWDAHVESEMLEASRAYQLAPDSLKAWSAADSDRFNQTRARAGMDSILMLTGYQRADTIQFSDGSRAVAWKKATR